MVREQLNSASMITGASVLFPALPASENVLDVFVATDSSGNFIIATQQAIYERMT